MSAGGRTNRPYDGVRVVNKHIAHLTVDITYLNQVNRIFGPKGLPGPNDGRFTGDIFLANVAWQTAGFGKLTGFGYLLDFDRIHGPLTRRPQTLGLRLQGEQPLAKIKVGYSAVVGHPEGLAATTRCNFSNDYYLAELTGSFRTLQPGCAATRCCRATASRASPRRSPHCTSSRAGPTSSWPRRPTGSTTAT